MTENTTQERQRQYLYIMTGRCLKSLLQIVEKVKNAICAGLGQDQRIPILDSYYVYVKHNINLNKPLPAVEADPLNLGTSSN